MTGVQKTAGQSANAFNFALNEGTKETNYDITAQEGTLTVTDRTAKFAVTVTAKSRTALYDGTDQTVSGFAGDSDGEDGQETAGSVSRAVVNGLTYTISGLEASASGRDAGSYVSSVTGTAVVTDEDGQDVTAQFEVSTNDGELVIQPRRITLTSASAEKMYDGDALTDGGVEVEGDGFAAGEGAAFDVTGTRTVPGSSDNTFTYSLNEGTSAANYEIGTRTGILNVTDRPADERFVLIAAAASGTELYDGSEKTLSGFASADGGQAEGAAAVPDGESLVASVGGHTYTVSGLTAEAAGTHAGTYENRVSGTAVVSDEAGLDVTDQFRIEKLNGRLDITPRQVVLTSASGEKVYDGVVLTDETVTVGGDGFADGEGAAFTVSGRQMVPGSSANTFIYELNEGTFAGDYVITQEEGLLTVNPVDSDARQAVVISGNSLTALYDGSDKTVSGLVGADSDGNVPFAFGELTYKVTGLEASASARDAGLYDVEVTGEPVVLDTEGNDVTDQFDVTVYPGTLQITKRSVMMTSGSAEKEFDGSPLGSEDVSVSGDGFAEGEGADYEVTGSQTYVGTSANTFDYTLTDQTKSDNYDIVKTEGRLSVTDRTAKYEASVTSLSASVRYDGKLHEISGLAGGTEKGVPVVADGRTYYISGLDASVSGTDAGHYRNVISGEASVTDEAGQDVTKQFLITYDEGTLDIAKRQVILTSASSSRAYDGTPLINRAVTVSGDGFAEGEGADYSMTGTQTRIGGSLNSFTYTLKEGTKEENYDISVIPGQLSVTGRSAAVDVKVTAKSGSFLYDGQEKSVEGLEGTSFIFNGQTYMIDGIKAEASAVHAGTYTVPVTGEPVVYDADGQNVSEVFAVSLVPGTLTIRPRQVILTSATTSKSYDGHPLTDATVTVGGDGFADGEGASYSVTGTRTTAGSEDNTFTYALNEGTSAGDYVIRTRNGRLTVMNRETRYEITVRSSGGQFLYDGSSHEVSGFAANEFVVDGAVYTVTGLKAAVSAVNAGTYPVTIEGDPVVLDSEGRIVTDQFAVNFDEGALVIRPRTVIMTSETASGQYNGSALTSRSVAVSGDGFAEGEGADYDITGEQTTVGASPNAFTYVLKSGTNPDNYQIRTSFGLLNVTGRDTRYALTMTARSGSALYDGTEQRLEGFVDNRFEIDGHIYTVSGVTAESRAVHAGSYAVTIEGVPCVTDEAGRDVTDQFAVNLKNGTFEILPRQVELRSITAVKTYDGDPLTTGSGGTFMLGSDKDPGRTDPVEAEGDGFAANDGISVMMTGIRTLPGESDNTFDWRFADSTEPGDYRVTETFGRLVVRDRAAEDAYPVIVRADSLETIYDGHIHRVETLTGTDIEADGHRYHVTGLRAYAEGIDTGIYEVSVTGTARVVDEAGNDVTEQFAVTTETGTLTIRKRTVILSTPTLTREYDGTPLEGGSVTVSGDGFADGEGADFDMTAAITAVGGTSNSFTYTLNEGTKADNYTITKDEGRLFVTNRSAAFEITVEAGSGSALYDGQPHTAGGLLNDTFTVGGQLYHVEGLTAEAEETDAGTYPVEITGTAVVKDEAGRDVSGQFIVNRISGSLEIRKRAVVLTSQTASAEYTGNALTAGDVTVSGDGFAEGESAVYTVTGSQTTAGMSDNTFDYEIAGGTKEANYDIRTVYGTLTVTSRSAKYAIEVEPVGDSVLYDGLEHRTGGLVTNRFGIGEHVYTVSGLEASASAVHAGIYPVNVTGTPVVTDEEGRDVTEEFRVTARPASLTIRPRTLDLRSADATAVYGGLPLFADTVHVGGDGFAEGEGMTFSVTGARTIVGATENSFTYSWNEGTNPADYIVRSACGVLTVTSRPENARYDIRLKALSGKALYDGQPHTVSGIAGAVEPETDGTEGTGDAGDTGDASDAGDTDITVTAGAGQTLNLNVGGRSYTLTGLNASATAVNAGTYPVNVTGTPYVTDSEGNDVTDQFMISASGGEMTILKRQITLTSGSFEHAYNGRAVVSPEVTVSGDGFAEGEGADFNVTGSRTLVGESVNTFTYELRSGTDAGNYDVTVEYGKLRVRNRDARYEVTVTARSAEYLYDGTEKTVSGLMDRSFRIGDVTYRITGLEAEAKGVDAGVYQSAVTGSAVILDDNGNDVTSQFTVKTVDGSLTIRPRTLILTSGTVSQPYDGNPLSGAEVTVSGDGFADGEGADYRISGTRTLVGTSENSFSILWNQGTKPGNYEVETVFGLINITSREARYPITLTANSDVVNFDGEEHSVSGFETKTFEVEGHSYDEVRLEASATGTDAGVYTTDISGQPAVQDADGHDVTGEFAVTVINGTLTIRNTYQLIIRYINEDGEEIADAYSGWYSEGEAFGPVPSPVIEGMTPEFDEIISGEGGMPASDIEIFVIYTADQADIVPTPVEPEEPTDTPEEPTVTPPEPTGTPDEPGQPDGSEPTPAPGGGSAPETDNGPAPQSGPSGPETEEAGVAVPTGEDDGKVRVGAVTQNEDGSFGITQIEDTALPLAAAPMGYWALLNLLMAIATVLMMAALLITWLLGRRRKEGEEDIEEAAADEAVKAANADEAVKAENTDDDEVRIKKKGLLRLLSIIPAVAAVIVFIRTEDMTNTMRMVDRWTIVMMILLIIQGILMVGSIRRKSEKADDEDEAAAETGI